MRRAWCQALSHPRPPVLWSGQPGFRGPCVPAAVGAGVGTQHRPHSVRPCGPALLAGGVAEGRPRGGCLPPLSGASEVRRCPSPDCPPTGRAVGVRHPRAVGAGVWLLGPNTVPLACMPCGGCVPRGWWQAVPRGEWPATVVRSTWCQALSPPPTARPLERAARGLRPVCPGCGRCGRGDPAPFPQRAPLRAGVARCGGGGRASPGGGAFHHCEGRLRSGAVPPPTARPLGGLLGSATHVLWARVCSCGGPTMSPWPACPVGAVHRGGGGGPSPGGLACQRCERRLVSGAVPPPATCPLERAARVLRPVCPGCGRCGRGDPAPAPQRAPLRAGVARCGGGGRASPGGSAFNHCEGRLRSGAVPPPTARPLNGLLGSATHVLSVLVCGCGGPTLSPWPACPVGGACRGGGGGGGLFPGGWPATVVRGVWCQALSLPRPPVLWSGRPGFCDRCVPGAVGAGVGTLHGPHGARPCGPALCVLGVAIGRPRGGCRPPL